MIRLIGYADTTTEPFDVGAGETVERTVRVPVRAVSLDGIRAEVGRRCRSDPGGASQTARLWEEARKALEIADWTDAQSMLRFRVVEHERELDAATLAVTAIREKGRSGYHRNSPYVSIPVEELETGGYVQPAGDGVWDYNGPDADVLLSRSFLDTHCFRVAASRDAGLVGLGFEPVPGRDLPDIEGVLWLDRGTAELRHLEFTYVNLPGPGRDFEQLGGRVEFERLATGVWIVRRWYIRMPKVVRQTGGYGIGARRELELVSLTEDGAEVVEVRTAAGEVLAEAVGAMVYGVVADSATGAPLPDATVELLPTGRRTATGPDGAYRLSGLPSGTFTVQVEHPHLGLLAGGPIRRVVMLRAGRATRLAVTPALERMARSWCEGSGLPDPVLVYGSVRDPETGSPADGALVRVGTPGAEQQVVADTAGAFGVCVPRSDSVLVAAVVPADAFRPLGLLERRTVDLSGGLVARADLELAAAARAEGLPPGVTPHRGETWTNAILGTVLARDGRVPIEGARVVARDAAGQPVYSGVSDADGRFRILHRGQGAQAYTVTVAHPAYGTAETEVVLRPAEEVRLEVMLAESAATEEVVAVMERRRSSLVEAGFYDRRERSRAGVFLTRAEIEELDPRRVTDLIRGRSGWRGVDTGPGRTDVRVAAVGPDTDCQPAIWIDGVLARDSGRPSRGAGLSGPIEPQLSELVAPEEVEALEAHRDGSVLPVRYRRADPLCGAVLIWTRRQPR